VVDQSKTVGEDYEMFTPYHKFLRHKFHLEILVDSPEQGLQGRQTRVGLEKRAIFSFMRQHLENGTG